MSAATLHVAVVGAGPVGLALSLLAARLLPQAHITLFDARVPGPDSAADPRTLALSLGSVQLLQRLQAWPADAAEPIHEVQVTQADPGFGARLAASEVRISAAQEGVALLGAVLPYGPLVAALQQAWAAAVAAEPQRLAARYGTAVHDLKDLPGAVEIDAGIAERFDLAVIAEGGVFAEQARRPLSLDYGQTAWVGNVTLDGAPPGVAFERFTRDGPLALLPLRAGADGAQRAALVWCVRSAADPLRALDDTARLALLNTRLPAAAGRVATLGPLKDFALGLNAERTLVRGRRVCIGNAAQTLHPVAGQGLNLGLRDAYTLASALRFGAPLDAALRKAEWARASDRWATIATTDFLARGFTWGLPGLGALAAAAMALLQAAPPLKHRLARQMMFGRR